MTETGDARRAQLRARVEATGAILGIPVRVTDDDAWELTEAGLRVGLGWYGVRGHPEPEAIALALLHLWEGPRNARVERARARRRESFARVRPEAAPLFDAVYRVQSTLELLSAMPGLRPALRSAQQRSIPSDVSAWPRHLQWVAVIVHAGLAGAADAGSPLVGSVPEVHSEWRGLLDPVSDEGAGGADAETDGSLGVFRRVLGPDPTRAAVRRYERAVAWLLPAYDRLAARDALDRGLDAGGGGADPAGDDADALGELASSRGASGDADAAGDDESGGEAETSDGGDANAESDDERARAGEGRETAEGADLFAAQQAGFMDRVLATPMPGGGRTDSSAPLPEDVSAGSEGNPPDPEGAGGGSGGGATRTDLADYLRRAAELADAIERMRAVWARVIVERAAPRRVASARPSAAGDDLAAESLAQAVAESLAGVPRPRAFRDRALRMRRTRRSGSTDYVLLVDRSASMQGAAAEAAADAMLIMTEALAGAARDVEAAERASGAPLELDIRTALIVFDSAVEVVKPLSAGLDDQVRRAVHGAIRSPRGSTNDGAALRAAALELGVIAADGASTVPRADGGLARRRVVILVSDGGSNDPVAAEHALRRLRRGGVEVHGIGIGTADLADRYAPQGRTLRDARALPEMLHGLLLDDVERTIR
ncbi:VWA domain-containing protein [Leucobacter chromiiresistens]